MTSETKRHWAKWFVAVIFLTGMGACSSTTEGIEVSLGVVHHPAPDSNGDIDAQDADVPRVFTNDLDYEITMTAAYVTLSTVEIEACESAMARLGKSIRRTIGIPSVYAHTEGSATLLGTPNVENILREDLEVLELGHIEPPAGDYCHAHIHLAPADADAEHLPEGIDMVGKTLYIEGTYTASGGGDPVEFSVESTATEEVELHFQNADHEEIELTLSTDEPETDLIFGMMYDRWFQGVDFESMSEAEIREAVLENVVSSLHHHAGAVHGGHDH